MQRSNLSRSQRLLPSKNSGFTLLELIIVCALVACIALLATSNFGLIDRMAVHAQIDRLYGLCHYLQRRAIARNQSCTLSFDVHNHTYQYDDVTVPLSSAVRFGTLPGAKGPPSSPTHALASPCTFARNEIIFHPDGIISSGTVYLVDRNQRWLYALSSPISQISFLRAYRYAQGWQQMS